MTASVNEIYIRNVTMKNYNELHIETCHGSAHLTTNNT